MSKISLSPHNTKRMVSGPSYLLYFSLNLSAWTPFFSPFPAYKKRRLAVPAAVVRCLTCCVVPVRLVARRTEGMFLGLSYAKQKQNQIYLKCSLSLEGSPLACPVREESFFSSLKQHFKSLFKFWRIARKGPSKDTWQSQALRPCSPICVVPALRRRSHPPSGW